MDKKQKKKLKRSAKKKKEKATEQKLETRLQDRLTMFDRLPTVCSVCESEFPKTKEAHMTWRVVVRSEKAVRLFCPRCQQLGTQLKDKANEI